MSTARLTAEKANSAPKLIMLATVSRVMNRATSDRVLTSMIAVAGTRFFVTRRPKARGNAPSRPMANSTRDTLAWDTMAEAKQPAT
ncbi:hypothetical protein D3C73_1324840 [compost metagenome]